ARSADVLIVDQLGQQNEKLASDAKSYFEILEKGDTLNEINPFLNSLFNPNILPFLTSYLAYNPSDIYQRVEAPVLVISGKADVQVPVEDAEALFELSPNSELVLIGTMNHVLKSVRSEQENFLSYGNPELPLHESLVPIIHSFLNK
ncbi:MAG: alpha/beta hydrolase, partial [Bacteroidota bacterium]